MCGHCGTKVSRRHIELVIDRRGGVFAEFLKHVLWNETARAGDGIVGLVPGAAVIDIAEDIEKVALFEREFLGSLWAVGG